MIEITERQGLELSYGFAGDTLNTAVYLAREFHDSKYSVDYMTAVGDDDFSKEMVSLWTEEGVGTDLVTVIAGELPGLYWVRTDAEGERSFYYWRKATAAQKLMQAARDFDLAERLSQYGVVYLSGITLAILPPESREELLDLLNRLNKSGVIVAFDTNYRPKLWVSREEAQLWITRLAETSRLAMVSFDDEKALYDDQSPLDSIQRLHKSGVREVVVKNGTGPCVVSDSSECFNIDIKRVVNQVDTTAAGDSFNAGYLSARVNGATLRQSVEKAQQLAAKVVQYPGAIIPR